MSFATIPFVCAVFDEMQKVKSPTSLLTRAAKTVNANFTVGLTGTPVENQMSDLWCIMDIINPGYLGDLKSFSEKFRPDDEQPLEQLHSTLLDPRSEGHPPMLRRMKANELEGLPEKRIHIRRRPMPEMQARVYAEVVGRAKHPESGPMLETLHLLRGVSLHPIWPPADEIKDQQAFISQSARLTEAFAILDDIAAQREKVLIFLESLDLQEHLALMIKTRYRLKRRPMQINGEVSGETRQKLVDEFQKERGIFDVMILSPRAGGVGITLTSANHVIHLSRWWNPAVEDQCTDRVYRIGQDRTVHVYYPMAVHPLYGDGSFDELLNALLTRKRKLSERMLLPPVNLKNDQNWFAENLDREAPKNEIEPADIADIDVMEPLAFERWALRRCVNLGWDASGTPKSHDMGADGVLVHRITNACAIVQCKHKQSANDVCGPEAIDELLRARSSYDGSARLFVLSNAEKCSRPAQERAERHGIGLIGRSELPYWPRQLLS
jgi:HJR/Mrr/RecB family endonuclease